MIGGELLGYHNNNNLLLIVSRTLYSDFVHSDVVTSIFVPIAVDCYDFEPSVYALLISESMRVSMKTAVYGAARTVSLWLVNKIKISINS